jgi:hypothetical protein
MGNYGHAESALGMSRHREADTVHGHGTLEHNVAHDLPWSLNGDPKAVGLGTNANDSPHSIYVPRYEVASKPGPKLKRTL